MRILMVVVMVLLAAQQAFAVIGGGDIAMKNRGGTVTFSHDAHVNAAGLKCQDCHAKLYTNVKQHKRVSMKGMQKGRSCGACHNGKAALSVKGNCTKCHTK